MRLLEIFKDILDLEKPNRAPSNNSAAAKDRNCDPTVRAGFEDLKSLLTGETDRPKPPSA